MSHGSVNEFSFDDEFRGLRSEAEGFCLPPILPRLSQPYAISPQELTARELFSRMESQSDEKRAEPRNPYALIAKYSFAGSVSHDVA